MASHWSRVVGSGQRRRRRTLGARLNAVGASLATPSAGWRGRVCRYAICVFWLFSTGQQDICVVTVLRLLVRFDPSRPA
jgi:hypothetical protein